ncbi:hypothetical protein MFIFM68171_01146 [Madurella fahalii]|uniref:Uncharacterized protein n=1 Tax=Madurella fahalii TaxID=1157608 RepID=A0ABQ0FZJ4_9PEZI
MLARICPRSMRERLLSPGRVSLSYYGFQSRAKLHFITVNLDPSRAPEAELKQAALNALKNSKSGDTQRNGSSNADAELAECASAQQQEDAAIILASRSLASWLEDTAFVSRLLKHSGLVGNPVSRQQMIHVLSAAVDEVPRFDRRCNSYASSEGLSILCGGLRNLPGLWKEGNVEAGAQSCLEFQVTQVKRTGQLKVNLPLANTVFSNGRPHTLFANLWQTDGAAGLRLVKRMERTTQAIDTGSASPGGRPERLPKAVVASRLVPVTEARRIVAGLGNILRQIDINGTSAPASKELEAIIPALLKERQTQLGQRGHHLAAGPIGVWALIMPAHVVEDRLRSWPAPLEPLYSKNYEIPLDEPALAKRMLEATNGFLAAGCQFRKILSGGGGWGSKQGLLSLDPQTRLAVSEQQDLEDFIKSFHGDHGSTGSIVAPGSYVQFFVEPALRPEQESELCWPRECYSASSPTVAIGTSGATPWPPQDDLAEAWPALFGAVSSQGLYLSAYGSLPDVNTVASKLDAPRSYVVSTNLDSSKPL